MSEPAPLLAPLHAAAVEPRLWKDGQFTADPWLAIADEVPVPIEGAVIVSLLRWRSERAALVARTAHAATPVGVQLATDDVPEPATDALDHLALIALSFPKFTDGRAYSTARRLREQFRFAGELRATGDVLLDQLPLMLRAGFDAFEIVSAATIAELEQAPVPAVHRVYQHSTGPADGGWRERRFAAVAR
jgi:uncharacterized protein (DUF934 family)